MNLVEILRERAASCPDRPAIVDLGGGARRPRVLTFAELDAAVADRAGVLASSGLAPGATVLLLQPMSASLYVALLAVLHRGMVAMFLDPSAGIAAVRSGCRQRPPDALIGTPKAHLLGTLIPELRAIPRRFTMGRAFPWVRSLAVADSVQPTSDPVTCDESAPALLTFTSGSTGQAKAMLRTHGFLRMQYRVLESTLALEAGEVDLTTLPIFLLANLAAGVTSVLPDVDLRHPGAVPPEKIAVAIRDHAVTRTAASPALLERLADHCRARGITLPAVRHVFTGGAPVFPRVLEKLAHVSPQARVAAIYGSTEAEPIAHFEGTRVEAEDLAAMYSGKGLLAGEPVPEIRLRILVDTWDRPVADLDAAAFDRIVLPQGVPGEIVVTGDHVLKGSLDAHADARIKIRCGSEVWHRTGDAGYLDERGRLWLLGRCGTQVSGTSGALYPFAVECAASSYPAVRRSALLGDAEGRRVLVIESDQPLSTFDDLARSLSWANLDALRVVDEIPVDARHNAKTDYTRLRRDMDRRGH